MKTVLLLLSIATAGPDAPVRISPRDACARVRLSQSINYAVWIDAGIWVRGPERLSDDHHAKANNPWGVMERAQEIARGALK